MIGEQVEGLVACQSVATWEEARTWIEAEDLLPREESFVLLVRADRVELGRLGEIASAGGLEAAWPRGHAFNPARELQWVREDDRYELRLLTEAYLPAGWEERARYETAPETALFLLGERREAEQFWRETGIPRHLAYPVRAPGRARLVVVPYLREGVPVLLRMKEVQGDEQTTG
jgi:hypothetical protein